MKRTRHYPLSSERVLEAANLNAAELRLLVANYYQSQHMRKTMDMQLRHVGDRNEVLDKEYRPLGISTYAAEAFADIEIQVAKALDKVLTSPVARWLKAQRGIGPIIAAGLIAHIDIEKAPTVGHIWRFAGLDPTLKWEKGQKRPYNAALKQICWHAGQCFMKQSNDPDCFYGKIYRERKRFEIERNEAGKNAEAAKAFKVSTGATKAVKDKLDDGKLPDFNIDARARRYAVKIFLSHLHFIMFRDRYGKDAPLPYSIAMLNHAHFIDIPHAEIVESTGVEERADAAESTRDGKRADLHESTGQSKRKLTAEEVLKELGLL